MISPSQLDEQAALHALDLLEGAERDLFLSRLQKDAALGALVDAYREALAQATAASTRPQSPESDVFARILERVNAPEALQPPADVAIFPEPSLPQAVRGRWLPAVTWLWPAAALFMLGINFYLVWLVVEAREQAQAFADQAMAEAGEWVINPEWLDRLQLPRDPGQLAQYLETMASEREHLQALAAQGASAEEQIVWLEARNQELLAERDQAELVYGELARRAAPLVDGAAGYARYTIMELARDDLWASMSVDQIIQFSRDGTDLSGSFSSFTNGASLSVNLPEGEPYAISHFDEISGRGEMYLVNLPETAEGRHLHLWMRDALGDGRYIPIGPIPQGHPGQELSITFDVAGEPITPVEMIVTDEPGPHPVQPVGPIVLRGPSAVSSQVD